MASGPPVSSLSGPSCDPQCPCLLERIAELKAALDGPAEPALRGHWQKQLNVVVTRARLLGCLDERPRRGLLGPPIP